MLNFVRHDTEFARVYHDGVVAELNEHLAAPYQEQLIFMLVFMSWKHASEFHQLHLLTVQLRDNLRTPMLVDQCKLLSQGCFLHTQINPDL